MDIQHLSKEVDLNCAEFLNMIVFAVRADLAAVDEVTIHLCSI
jgi:hypothetical protein